MTILQSAIAQSAAGGGAYQISRSLRFNIADSTYLNRTPASATNRQIFTYSLWIKNSGLPSSIQRIFGVGVTNYFGIDIGYSAGEFNINVDLGPDATRSQNYTTATFRDPSAWYNFVIAVDTTQATTANRLKIYVNNVLYSYSSTASIPQNLSTDVNNTVAHNIGRRVDGSDRYCSLYMTEINLIDGQQLTPSSFGETSATTGVWNPIDYTGTYGTNGFYLNFSDNSNTTAATLGADTSGNGNNFTPNNFSVTAGVGNDSLVDSPTNYGTDTGVGGEVRGNYATLNRLKLFASNFTISNGNLDATDSGASNISAIATMATPTSGKWYFEATAIAQPSSGAISVGLLDEANAISSTSNLTIGSYRSNGNIYNIATTAQTSGATYVANDVIGIAIDADAGTVKFYKNGAGQGATPSFSFTAGIALYPYIAGDNISGAKSWSMNFGQRPFAYTAPSGFKALCTQNLPTPAIGATSTTLAGKNFDATLYTGNGSTQSITNASSFQPDFVWIKKRNAADGHDFFDAVRGTGKLLQSNSTSAESGNTGDLLSAFNSNGFTVNTTYAGGTNGSTNNNGDTYVGWQWKGGNGTVSNTSGSITSTVSANPTAGISIVTYTIPSASATIETFGHGLNATPSMVIFKVRNAADEWTVYNRNITTPLSNWVTLNTTAAAGGSTSTFSSSSTTFGVRGTRLLGSGASGNIVAYCFAEVAGFSKFSTYVGNGSTDGPFIYCGFRPKYIMVKRTDSTGDWKIWDATRVPYNVDNLVLWANLSNAEGSQGSQGVDLLSNGVKMRSNDTIENAANGTYIFMAFAESPFNYSRAR
jgi:hypothetical protein